jgi:hypothetical protein
MTNNLDINAYGGSGQSPPTVEFYNNLPASTFVLGIFA